MEHVDTSKMTEQELQFHYFKMHDTDGNNKLDGLELVKSLIHWHDEANHDPKSGQPKPEPKIFLDEELQNMIDPILESDDKNKDGFIDYPEFIAAQQAAASTQTPMGGINVLDLINPHLLKYQQEINVGYSLSYDQVTNFYKVFLKISCILVILH